MDGPTSIVPLHACVSNSQMERRLGLYAIDYERRHTCRRDATKANGQFESLSIMSRWVTVRWTIEGALMNGISDII